MWLPPFQTLFFQRLPVSVTSMVSRKLHARTPSLLFSTNPQIVFAFLSPYSLAKGRRFHLITSWFSVKLGWVTLLHIAI